MFRYSISRGSSKASGGREGSMYGGSSRSYCRHSIKPLCCHEETVAQMLNENDKGDPCDMTYSRRFVSWLYPKTSRRREKTEEILEKRGLEVEVPDIRKSWMFFEHFILPRYVVNPDNPGAFERAVPGEQYEHGTKLYPIFTFNHMMLAEFGLGTGLYFVTVLFLAISTGVAGLINLFLMHKYQEKSNLSITSYKTFMRSGSAHCNNTTNVVVENFKNITNTRCTPEYTRTPLVQTKGLYNTTTQTCTIPMNECSPDFIPMGAVHYGTMIVLTLAMYYFFFRLQKRLETYYDEENLTTQDYAIQVKNPPARSIDPDDWRDFFDPFSEEFVNSVTVVINNEDLVNALVERRVLIENLKFLLPAGTVLNEDTKADIREKASCLFLCNDAPLKLLKKIDAVEERIAALADEDKIDEVTHVFVTFETELGKRNVMQAFSYGKLDRRFNTKRMEQILQFRDRYLEIDEPAEPSAVRWHNLDESMVTRVLQQTVTFFLTLVIMTVGFLCIYYIDKNMNLTTSYFITFFNIAIPMFCRIITSYESHPREGRYQGSLYLKIALVRWVNTVLIQYFIKPFSMTANVGIGEFLSEQSLMEMVASLFFSEIVITPLWFLFDPFTIYAKFVSAPRALSQRSMNLCFQGNEFSLAERYTSLTKLIFFCFFYAAVFPGSYLYCSIAMWIIYFVDRYMLFRRCRIMPANGPYIAKISRDYFFTIAILFHFIMTAFWWSGFPFDNVGEYGGKYYFVNQDIMRTRQWTFPALPSWQLSIDQPKNVPKEWKGWMSPNQEFIVHLTGWTSAAMLCISVVLICRAIGKKIKRKLFYKYKHRTRVQNIDFSDKNAPSSLSLYIPQVVDCRLPYPVLACDICEIQAGFIEWKDPNDESYDTHNLVNDMRDLGYDIDGEKKLFSIVKQWKKT